MRRQDARIVQIRRGPALWAVMICFPTELAAQFRHVEQIMLIDPTLAAGTLPIFLRESGRKLQLKPTISGTAFRQRVDLRYSDFQPIKARRFNPLAAKKTWEASWDHSYEAAALGPHTNCRHAYSQSDALWNAVVASDFGRRTQLAIRKDLQGRSLASFPRPQSLSGGPRPHQQIQYIC